VGFNLGVNGLRGFKKTLKLIQEGMYKEAATAMLQSCWAKQVRRRAKELAQLMRGKE
jgi:lysozyme